MKKVYIAPEMVSVEFEVAEIITASQTEVKLMTLNTTADSWIEVTDVSAAQATNIWE
ncbi:MAG: hypothetical protein ACI4CT_02070 [Lachnospiraceae bacterium]